LFLRVAAATIAAGEPHPVEHDALVWLAADELPTVDWLDADRPFLEEIRRSLLEG
jgi:8-oxo-dGTP diphosphatase